LKPSTSILKSLVDINDVTSLTDSDAPMVQEIVDVLRKYDALDRFGLTLLHQHFPISDDEVLLESTDISARTQLIRPVPKASLESLDYVETSWRLDTGVPMMHCACGKDQNGNHTHRHIKTAEEALLELESLQPA
jgi:hypothetical protein